MSPRQIITCTRESLPRLLADLAAQGLAFECTEENADCWRISITGY